MVEGSAIGGVRGKGRSAFDGEGRSALFGRAIDYTGLSYSGNTMTQSNELSQRVDQAEGQIVDLQLTANLILQAIYKNSTDIAQLIEVSKVLQTSQIRAGEAIQDIRGTLASVNATLERMDRLFDYLIRRDQGRFEE